jgi:crotonobetainyl-CoA:carnitine CoA-transferase CaiB-like acyl-CoA transferase
MNDQTVRPFAAPEDLPLAGVRVVDMSRFLAGPYAATLLGDLGADVIKVEALDRDDPAAHTAPMSGEDSMYYLSTVRNKRSIRVDLRSPEGHDVLRRLCADADIVIENYRRDVPAKLGLTYDDFRAMNKRIVVCSVRSFAKDSVVGDNPAYDSLVQAYSGIMSVTGEADGEVARAGVAVADLGTGIYASTAVLAALHRAQRTGTGGHLEIALTDAGISLMSMQVVSYLNTGTALSRSGTEHPSMAPQRVFETATTPVFLMAAKDEEFAKLCRVIDRLELLTDERFRTNADRVRNRTVLHATIQTTLAQRPADEWLGRFSAALVAAAPVRTVAEVADDPDFRATMMSTHEHPRLGSVDLVRNPITWQDGSLPFRTLAPDWGGDTDDLLTELGYDGQAIAELHANDVVR